MFQSFDCIMHNYFSAAMSLPHLSFFLFTVFSSFKSFFHIFPIVVCEKKYRKQESGPCWC